MNDKRLPAGSDDPARRPPDVWEVYASLGRACAEARPLDARARRLVKLALAVGACSEGAVHSHVRRAIDESLEPGELYQVALLAFTTLGLPAAAAATLWIDDVVTPDDRASGTPQTSVRGR